MGVACPSGCEGNDREPEQEVKIRPQSSAVHLFCDLKQMMVIVPIDAEVNEAEDVTHERRNQVHEFRPLGMMGRAQFQHHDGDEDGNDSVTKCF